MSNLPPNYAPKPDPYLPPQQQYAPPADPRGRLSGPGVGLIIVGIFSALSALTMVGWAIFMTVAAQSIGEVTSHISEMDTENELSDADREAIGEVSESMSMLGQGMGVTFMVIGSLLMVTSCLIIYGGIQMTRARSFTICMVAACLAMLPTGCWLLSLPIGIWALIVLLDGKVKASFT